MIYLHKIIMINSILNSLIKLENDILTLNFIKKNEFTMIGLYISFLISNYLIGTFTVLTVISILTANLILLNKKVNKKSNIDFKEHLMVDLKIQLIIVKMLKFKLII